MKTGLLLGIVTDANSKTRVRCVFCGVYIPKANKCIEQHTNGSKHQENMELMTENGIRFIADTLYCKLCNKNLTQEDSVTKHIIESEDHSNCLAAVEDLIDGEFIKLESYLAPDKEDVHCEACNINFDCSLQSIQDHVNAQDHRACVVERLKPSNGIFSVENDYEVWCKVCDEYIDNTVQGILNHIDNDESHMGWFMEIEDLIEEQEVSIREYLTDENEQNAFCNQCQSDVVCNAQSIEEHVYSEAHLNNFNQQ